MDRSTRCIFFAQAWVEIVIGENKTLTELRQPAAIGLAQVRCRRLFKKLRSIFGSQFYPRPEFGIFLA